MARTLGPAVTVQICILASAFSSHLGQNCLASQAHSYPICHGDNNIDCRLFLQGEKCETCALQNKYSELTGDHECWYSEPVSPLD